MDNQHILLDPGLGNFRTTFRDEKIPHKNIEVVHTTENHQVFYRVAGGSGGLWQRCLAWIRKEKPRGQVPGENPDAGMGGEIWPSPTDWSAFPEQTGPDTTYYWFGHYHKNRRWHPDKGIRVKGDRYENGLLVTLFFDDTGEDWDFDDFIIEVAMVFREDHKDKTKYEEMGVQMNEMFHNIGSDESVSYSSE
jgi:hypothetical protein